MEKLEDGAYRAEYRGFFSNGVALFEKRGDAIIGHDLIGTQYFGSCKETGDSYRFELDLHISAPSTLVTDGRRRDAGENIPIRLDLSADDLGQTISVQQPNGPLLLTIDRIGDLPTE